MIAVIGVVVCAYVFLRGLELFAQEAPLHPAVRTFAAVVAVGALLGAGLVIRSASDSAAALRAITTAVGQR